MRVELNLANYKTLDVLEMAILIGVKNIGEDTITENKNSEVILTYDNKEQLLNFEQAAGNSYEWFALGTGFTFQGIYVTGRPIEKDSIESIKDTSLSKVANKEISLVILFPISAILDDWDLEKTYKIYEETGFLFYDDSKGKPEAFNLNSGTVEFIQVQKEL